MDYSYISIYTDGSYNPKKETGGWAAIVLVDDTEELLKGREHNSTHNRMELLAVINAIQYVKHYYPDYHQLHIYTDSQYVVELPTREQKLQNARFKTRKGKVIRNADLVKTLLSYLSEETISLTKVRAHQKKTEERNYNREVDKIARRIVREE